MSQIKPIEQGSSLAVSQFNDLSAGATNTQRIELQDHRTISVTALLFFGLSLFVGWAAFFEIDQSVRASGQIIPSARTQVIQAADGGVLSELLVQEGEVVSAGQLLAVLEKERVNATFEEGRSKVAALSLALIRAQAETLQETPDFGNKFNDYPDFIKVQRRLYEQRRHGLDDEIRTLRFSLEMANQELNMNKNLLSTGDASQLEVMRAQRQVSEIEGKINAARNLYLREAHQEAATLEAELDAARHKLDERRSVLEHTEIKTPVTGIVKFLKLNTVGGVLRSGDELMQISPTESGVVFEAKIQPIDIGQLTIGLPVFLKLDAFDFSVYGSVAGTLSYISSDTLTEQNSADSLTYYRAHISVNDDFQAVNPKFKNIKLKPGMTASADIQTGKRSVLNYLARPVTRAFSGALTER